MEFGHVLKMKDNIAKTKGMGYAGDDGPLPQRSDY